MSDQNNLKEDFSYYFYRSRREFTERINEICAKFSTPVKNPKEVDLNSLEDYSSIFDEEEILESGSASSDDCEESTSDDEVFLEANGCHAPYDYFARNGTKALKPLFHPIPVQQHAQSGSYPPCSVVTFLSPPKLTANKSQITPRTSQRITPIKNNQSESERDKNLRVQNATFTLKERNSPIHSNKGTTVCLSNGKLFMDALQQEKQHVNRQLESHSHNDRRSPQKMVPDSRISPRDGSGDNNLQLHNLSSIIGTFHFTDSSSFLHKSLIKSGKLGPELHLFLEQLGTPREKAGYSEKLQVQSPFRENYYAGNEKIRIKNAELDSIKGPTSRRVCNVPESTVLPNNNNSPSKSSFMQRCSSAEDQGRSTKSQTRSPLKARRCQEENNGFRNDNQNDQTNRKNVRAKKCLYESFETVITSSSSHYEDRHTPPKTSFTGRYRSAEMQLSVQGSCSQSLSKKNVEAESSFMNTHSNLEMNSKTKVKCNRRGKIKRAKTLVEYNFSKKGRDANSSNDNISCKSSFVKRSPSAESLLSVKKCSLTASVKQDDDGELPRQDPYSNTWQAKYYTLGNNNFNERNVDIPLKNPISEQVTKRGNACVHDALCQKISHNSMTLSSLSSHEADESSSESGKEMAFDSNKVDNSRQTGLYTKQFLYNDNSSPNGQPIGHFLGQDENKQKFKSQTLQNLSTNIAPEARGTKVNDRFYNKVHAPTPEVAAVKKVAKTTTNAKRYEIDTLQKPKRYSADDSSEYEEMEHSGGEDEVRLLKCPSDEETPNAKQEHVNHRVQMDDSRRSRVFNKESLTNRKSSKALLIWSCSEDLAYKRSPNSETQSKFASRLAAQHASKRDSHQQLSTQDCSPTSILDSPIRNLCLESSARKKKYSSRNSPAHPYN